MKASHKTHRPHIQFGKDEEDCVIYRKHSNLLVLLGIRQSQQGLEQRLKTQKNRHPQFTIISKFHEAEVVKNDFSFMQH